jgi:hypothetical protein
LFLITRPIREKGAQQNQKRKNAHLTASDLFVPPI